MFHDDIRAKFIPGVFRNLLELLKPNNKAILEDVAKFVEQSLVVRNPFLDV